MKRNEKDFWVRKSCINGKVVWVGRCKTYNASCVAYHKAVKAEKARRRHERELDNRRKHNILAMLNEYLAWIPIIQPLTPEQVKAAKFIRSLSEEQIASHGEFYDHIVESERRRAETKEIHRQMRERAAKRNDN